MRNFLRHPLPQAFILLIVVLVVFFGLQAVLAAVFRIGAGNLTPALGLLLGLAGVAAALVTIPLARRMEGESLAGVGFPAKNVARDLLGGIALGGTVQALAFGSMAVAGWYTVSSVTVDVVSLATMTLIALCVAFWEEWAFRSVLVRLPEKAIGSWWALVLAHRHPHWLESVPELGSGRAPPAPAPSARGGGSTAATEPMPRSRPPWGSSGVAAG